MSTQRPDPTLLPDGDILAPERNTVTGEYRAVVVPVGSEHHAAWLARIQSDNPGRRVWKAVMAGTVLTLVALAFWWSTGSMDSWLVDVGLNKNPCVKSISGGAFCGDDAKRLCAQPLFGSVQACQDIRKP